MANITIIDSIMGSGKTTWIINEMNRRSAIGPFEGNGSTTPYLYIGMYLNEAQRIREACPDMEFVCPEPMRGRKLEHLNHLLDNGSNIASTHALFREVNRKTYETLKETPYTLVIDETVDCVEIFPINQHDLRTLFDSRMVTVDDHKRVRWNHGKWPAYDGTFWKVRDLADNGNLVMLRDKMMIWELPADFLELFEEVFVMTYLFEGSLMASYLRANGVQYKTRAVQREALVDTGMVDEGEIKSRLRGLITVVENRGLNGVGDPTNKKENPLSASWFRRDIKQGGKRTSDLKRATYNFFRNVANTSGDKAMWSCWKDQKGRLKGKGYTKGWVPCNTKATNDHIERSALAYLVNVFIHPQIAAYFQENGIEPDQELYALSEMVQWIWRSQVRRGDPITVYVPSRRMRTLLNSWLRDMPTSQIRDLAQAA